MNSRLAGHLIVVGTKVYRVWSGASLFRHEDLVRTFDTQHHLRLARLVEQGLTGPDAETASLGIRTIHGLATEAFFAILFAVLQAPTAPVAWLLLYKPKDLRLLLGKVQRNESFPCRFELAGFSWHDIAHVLIPAEAGDADGANLVDRFAELWSRMAEDFVSESARNEFNSLKHGLRVRPASPVLSIGGLQITAAEHGSQFPFLTQRGTDVLLNLGCRSWSAHSLIGEIELISFALANLVAVLKQLHGVGQPGELSFLVPTNDEFQAALPPRSQLLSGFALQTNWPENSSFTPLNQEEGLAEYQRLGLFSMKTTADGGA